MKRQKRPTRRDKKSEHGTVSNYRRVQKEIDRLEALSEYEPALYQLLTPLAWAQLKVANEVLKEQRYKAYEGIEQSLLMEKERN